MSNFKPIETQYKGYRFRSRLEARWAVFLDAVGLDFEYEKEGFDLGAVGYYLPDFYLPSLDTWVEIKPSGGEKDSDAIAKCHSLALGEKKPVLLIAGNPGPDSYEHHLDYGMELFGGMPWDMYEFQFPGRGDDPFEHAWMHGASLFESLREFLIEKIEQGEYLTQEDAAEYIVFALDEKERRKAIVEMDKLCYRRKYGKEHPHRQMRTGPAKWRFTHDKCWIEVSVDAGYYSDFEPEIKRGLELARSARFEHGESPLVRSR